MKHYIGFLFDKFINKFYLLIFFKEPRNVVWISTSRETIAFVSILYEREREREREREELQNLC